MRGHEPIIAMRQKGKVPSIVFINEYPCVTDWHEHGDHATVQILRDEVIGLLDLRFLIRLTTSISASNPGRAKLLAEACKSAGAKTVAACSVILTANGYRETNWSEVWHQTPDEVI